jgi:dihydrofolate reductase
MISLVLARADNGVIGDHGAIPWRIPEDMRRFKALTMGKPIIAGRKTWESFPKRPLDGRLNIVVTRTAGYEAPGATIARNLDEAIAAAGNADEIAIVGGAEIYLAALPRAEVVHLTEVHMDAKGDVTLPEFDRDVWVETAREEHVTSAGLAYSYVTLERR